MNSGSTTQELVIAVGGTVAASITVTSSPTGPTTPRLALISDCDTFRGPVQYGTTDASGTSQLTYANHTGATPHLLFVAYAASGFVYGTFDLSF